jgi:hypothetical protein
MKNAKEHPLKINTVTLAKALEWCIDERSETITFQIRKFKEEDGSIVYGWMSMKPTTKWSEKHDK